MRSKLRARCDRCRGAAPASASPQTFAGRDAASLRRARRRDRQATSRRTGRGRFLCRAGAGRRLGRLTIADLTTGSCQADPHSGRRSATLRWCDFVAERTAGLPLRGNRARSGVGCSASSRLVAINSDGSNVKQLGQARAYYDAGIRQYDGEVIDWLPDEGRHRFSWRAICARERQDRQRLMRTTKGWASTGSTPSPSRASRRAARAEGSDYMTDGRGNVRLMSLAGVDDSPADRHVEILLPHRRVARLDAAHGFVDDDGFQCRSRSMRRPIRSTR